MLCTDNEPAPSHENEIPMHSMDTNGINGMYLDRDIATAIGRFFFDQSVVIGSASDDWSKEVLTERCKITTKTIDSFKIVNIHFDGKDICITTSRPGLLIGRKAEQCEKLREYLSKEFTFDNIRIIENRVISSLYDYHYVLTGFE